MNSADLETLLRKAPAPEPPKGLLERIQADMHHPRGETPTSWSAVWARWWKRWVPATAFVLAITGIGLLAVQSVTRLKLHQENQQLKPAPPEPMPAAEFRPEASELEKLRKNAAEARRLRSEIDALRARASELAQLRAENARLRQRLGTVAGVGGSDAEMVKRSESAKCINNLKQIGLAARVYAADHQDAYPKAFLDLTNELVTPGILHCPSDTDRPELTEWSDYTPNSPSYQSLLSPDADPLHPSIIVRCPIHHHVCLSDGSIYRDPAQNGIQTVTRNGKEYLLLPPPPTNAPASFQ
jgi:hypothetical protein